MNLPCWKDRFARYLAGEKNDHADEFALSSALIVTLILFAVLPLALGIHYSIPTFDNSARFEPNHVALGMTLVEYDNVVQLEKQQASGKFDRLYPDDNSPRVPTLVFPCRVTPLPGTLETIPPSHREYLDHGFAVLIHWVHLRLEIHQTAHEDRPPHSRLRSYLRESRTLKLQWQQLTVPRTLQPFHDDILNVMELQRMYYSDAIEKRRFGFATERIQRIPEGIQANALIENAWRRLESRYPNLEPSEWSALHSHLQAMRLF